MTAPQEIIDAIKKVRATIKPMGHDAENPHGGYNYVSIDKYYTHVAKIVTDVGLIWRTTEVDYQLVDGQGRSKDRTFVKVKFRYDLYAGSSSFEDYMNLTILSPVDGPQTTGQVFSYADKVFMRVAFCVPTGEKDADANAPGPVVVQASGPDPILGDQPPPPHDQTTGEIIPEEQWHMSDEEKTLAPKFKDGLPLLDTRKIAEQKAVLTIETIFKTFLPFVKSQPKLTDWRAENLAAIEKVKTIDPAVHDRITELFRKRWSELNPKKEK